MSRICLVQARSASLVLLLASFACTQLFSQTQSLGDVAREQKDARKQYENNSKPAKVLTNDDLTPGTAAATSGTTSLRAASAEGQDPQTKESKSTASERQPVETKNVEEDKDNLGGRSPVGSILDRPKDSRPDVIVVPAGTELKVDIGEHKAVIPVRVGFATPIPALSQVTVEVMPSYFAIPYSYGDAHYYAGIPNVGYIEYATLTAVTVGGKTYQVKTDSLPLSIGGTNSEVTFVLGEPLKILR
jgi:hypothetical protein